MRRCNHEEVSMELGREFAHRLQAIAQEFFLDFHDRKDLMIVRLPKEWLAYGPGNMCGIPVEYTTLNTVEIEARGVGMYGWFTAKEMELNLTNTIPIVSYVNITTIPHYKHFNV